MYKASLLKLTKYYGNIIEKIKVVTEIHNIHELKVLALRGHKFPPNYLYTNEITFKVPAGFTV